MTEKLGMRDTVGDAFYHPYLRRLAGTHIARTVAKMEIVQSRDGRYRVTDRYSLPSLTRTVASAKTKDEAIRRAREAVRRETELLVCQLIFERHVLLRGLRFEEVDGRWYMLQREFERLLGRIAKRHLAIFGIEAWRRKLDGERAYYDFHDVRVYELEPVKRRPTNPRWYFGALRDVSQGRRDLWFSCSVDIPPNALGLENRP